MKNQNVMKLFLVISVVFSLNSCSFISSYLGSDKLTVDELYQLDSLIGTEKDDFLLEKSFELSSNDDGIKSFEKGNSKETNNPDETVKLNIKKGFTEYTTLDKEHFDNIIQSLKEKLEYKNEQANEEGIILQTYEKDKLWALTTSLPADGKTLFLIRLGNNDNWKSSPQLPVLLSGTWARTGEVLIEGNYEFNIDGTFVFNHQRDGEISGKYEIDYKKNEITFIYNHKVKEYDIPHSLSDKSEILKIDEDKIEKDRLEGEFVGGYHIVVLKKMD